MNSNFRNMSLKKTGPKTITINIRHIPASLRAQFKAACARREISMQQQFIQMMRNFVRDNR